MSTEFFQTPERAHEWFVETVITPNPRLTESEKTALTQVANDCYDSSTAGWWGDPLGLFEHGQDDAAQYFNCLRNSIQSVTMDTQILAILDIATDASLDVADPPDSMLNQTSDIITGKDSIDIPWWVYAGAGLAIFAVLRR